MKPLLNSQQIMDYLSIGRRKFQELVREDETFPAIKVEGRWKADPDALKLWVESFAKDDAVPAPIEKKGRVAKAKTAVPPPGGWQINIPC